MKVLFIGNSYTFYNDVPAQLSGLARSDEGAGPIQTEYVAFGGADLEAHYRGGAAERVAEPQWTHVVLQEKSTGTLHASRAYRRYVVKLGRRAHGKVLLYETWARQLGHEVYRWPWSGRRPSGMLRRIRRELAWAARTLGAEIVPVGQAWERCLERYPKMVLHDTDMHHASPLGSHLAACVFFAWLTGQDPEPLSFGADGVNDEDARRLRSVARDVVRQARDA